MSRKSKILVTAVSITILLSTAYYAILIHPVKVELVLIEVIEADSIQRPNIWWVHVGEHNKDNIRLFDETAMDFIMNYEYTQGNLVVSWGRPLESITYRRVDYYLRGDRRVQGRSVFSPENTPTTILIYNTTNAGDILFRNFPFFKNSPAPAIWHEDCCFQPHEVA